MTRLQAAAEVYKKVIGKNPSPELIAAWLKRLGAAATLPVNFGK